MILLCTLQNGSEKEVVVPFNPPLRGPADVKPRLLEMKAIAYEGLGMVSAQLVHRSPHYIAMATDAMRI